MNLTVKYALLTSLGLIIFFIAMRVIGQETNYYLRFFNGFIVIAGTYFLLKKMFHHSDSRPTYFEGLGSGMLMNVVAVFVFLIFMAIYVNFIDNTFMDVMDKARMWGQDLSVSEVSFAIFIEGMTGGLIISFALMQYFKRYSDPPASSEA